MHDDFADRGHIINRMMIAGSVFLGAGAAHLAPAIWLMTVDENCSGNDARGLGVMAGAIIATFARRVPRRRRRATLPG